MIRSLWPSDLEQLKIIHEKYYKHEFEFPDFYKNFLCAFTVVENDEIIVSGGIRTILESVIITDQSRSPRMRRSALYEILQASSFIASKYEYDQIHATVIDDDKWKHQLGKVGFKPVNGSMLVLNL